MIRNVRDCTPSLLLLIVANGCNAAAPLGRLEDAASAEARDARASEDASPVDLWVAPDLLACGRRPVSFAEPIHSETGNYTARPVGAIAVADFNHDGRADVAQVGTEDRGLTQAVVLLLGSENGRLTVGSVKGLPVAAPQRLTTIVAADFDQDGFEDVAVADWQKMMDREQTFAAGWTVVTGDGRGGLGKTVSSWGPVSGNDSRRPVAVGDLNRDGFPDLVAVHGRLLERPNVSVWVNSGLRDGRLTAKEVAPLCYDLLALADFNEDRAADLAATRSTRPEEYNIFLGDGNGGFALQGDAIQPRSSAGPVLLAGDLDHDGHADLLRMNFGVAGLVLLGDGRGSFRRVPLAQSATGAAVLADLTGDGGPDLIMADAETNAIAVLVGQCDGTFAPPASFAVGGPIQVLDGTLGAADVDGDNQLDLVVARLDRHITVLRNTTR